MAIIPLIEHEHPRVVLLDFSERDVKKFQQAGFEAKRGATGVVPNDREEFLLPYPVQEVEIVFASIRPTTFRYSKQRKPHADSCETEALFGDMLREVRLRAGWNVFFVNPDCRPVEFNSVGIDRMGVRAQNKVYEPAGAPNSDRTKPLPSFPDFVGYSLNFNRDEPETAIIERFVKSANFIVLTCPDYPLESTYIEVDNRKWRPTYLAQDTSTNNSVIAMKIYTFKQDGPFNDVERGAVLFLPDFGDNNVNVGLALMQEVIPLVSPHLFDAPQHSWLDQYQPASVLRLQVEKQQVLAQAQQEANQLDERVEEERQKFAWLPGLLVNTGNEFATNVAEALRYLGFDAIEVDNNLQPGERKTEDFHIRDESGYFAIGEAKTTGKNRGAGQDFISKTQAHQISYGRNQKQSAPLALLFVNYAIDLEPSRRGKLFFQEDLRENLKESGITAIDSVALWELCQAVMEERTTNVKARETLISGEPFVRIGIAAQI